MTQLRNLEYRRGRPISMEIFLGKCRARNFQWHPAGFGSWFDHICVQGWITAGLTASTIYCDFVDKLKYSNMRQYPSDISRDSIALKMLC